MCPFIYEMCPFICEMCPFICEMCPFICEIPYNCFSGFLGTIVKCIDRHELYTKATRKKTKLVNKT